MCVFCAGFYGRKLLWCSARIRVDFIAQKLRVGMECTRRVSVMVRHSFGDVQNSIAKCPQRIRIQRRALSVNAGKLTSAPARPARKYNAVAVARNDRLIISE